MNQVFTLQNEKSWKSVYVTSEKLLLINKSYNTPEEFLKGYQDDGLGRLLKQKKEIIMAGISGLQHPEKEPTDLTLHYDGKKITLTFSSHTDLQTVASFLAAERKLSGTIQQVNKLRAIQSPLIGLIFSLGLGWVLFTEAQTLEAGGTIEVTGRRAGVKRLFAWLAETLGTTGILLLAGLCVAVSLFFIYKNMKTPPNQVVYTI